MLDPKKQAEFEQSLEMLIETYPPMLKRFFDALVNQGFTLEYSFALTRDFLRCVMGSNREG